MLKKQNKAPERVMSFYSLKNGWHYGEGVRPKDKTLWDAQQLLLAAKYYEVEKSNAFPGIAGEVQVFFYLEKSGVGFEFNGEKKVKVTIETTETEDEIGEMTLNESIRFLGEFLLKNSKKDSGKNAEWKSYDSSTRNTIGTLTYKNSPLSHLETALQNMEEVYRSLQSSAHLTTAILSAIILKNSIRKIHPIQQSIGYLSSIYLKENTLALNSNKTTPLLETNVTTT